MLEVLISISSLSHPQLTTLLFSRVFVSSPSLSLRVGRIPSHKGRVRVLRKSRFGAGDCTTSGWFLVRAILYRYRGARVGAPDWSRHHGFRYRPEQRGCRQGVFHGREHDDWREYLRYGRPDWYWRSGPSEFGPPRPDVFVLQV